ncbi:MAG TPA: thioredoxin family protein [Thermopetrobacter sp.]|nr:thioredoxin family protein [Thermopetrobacter sp.]
MAVSTPICDFGRKAPDFTLPGVDGKTYSLADIRGEKGTLVVFICNHCPYVKAIIDRLVRDAKALQEAGIGVVAISSNDVENYPEDSFDNMKAFAERHGFTFPYLYDETQEVAKAYGAVCTPDFFGFNTADELQYRGRLDSSGKQPAAPDARRELYEAMVQVAETGRGPEEQTPSMGCSIKWKPGNEPMAAA